MPLAICNKCTRIFHLNLTSDGWKIWQKNHKPNDVPVLDIGPCCYKSSENLDNTKALLARN